MDAALKLLEGQSVVRPRDLVAHRIPADYLDRLYRMGRVERIGRGLYVNPKADIGANHSLALAVQRVPRGTVCLLSALSFHELTTQVPSEVWLALPPKAWASPSREPKLRIVRFSGPALNKLVETHLIEGIQVRVYGIAKTVADCFKFRNKLGLDVALEALRDSWHRRKASMDDFWEAARVCRMTNVMRPYLESLA